MLLVHTHLTSKFCRLLRRNSQPLSKTLFNSSKCSPLRSLRASLTFIWRDWRLRRALRSLLFFGAICFLRPCGYDPEDYQDGPHRSKALSTVMSGRRRMQQRHLIGSCLKTCHKDPSLSSMDGSLAKGENSFSGCPLFIGHLSLVPTLGLALRPSWWMMWSMRPRSWTSSVSNTEKIGTMKCWSAVFTGYTDNGARRGKCLALNSGLVRNMICHPSLPFYRHRCPP